jgi:dihydroxyacetone kinase
MTRLFNDPADFRDELIDGFVAAHDRWVRRVPGGVARRAATPPGRVAVVIGGGSGHYPAFAGLVGDGLASGAVLGNVFASPSAAEVVSVATAVERGGGVLLCYGNYAGDVLNFDQAQERLRGAGIACRTVQVTDDISSAPVDERGKRRGVAGDLVVFKIAGALAGEGADLGRVAAVAARANDRTRSFGVAFSGCTLPGAGQPLFVVPPGRMAVGLGIHGEPGLDEVPVPTADELAELFVARLLGELPEGVGAPAGGRVAVVLNGLGVVKYEELFVVYRTVAELLGRAGVEIVEPEVGEFCTSFDMAGVSLTLTWLDEELERLWRAPAAAPAYRKGAVTETAQQDEPQPAAEERPVTYPAASEGSRAVARTVAELFGVVEATIDAHAEELGRIDAVAGDGDHGIGMQRGARAAVAAARSAYAAGAGAGSTLAAAADAWADRSGGTSGALWGVALRRMAAAVGDEVTPDAAAWAAAVHAARDGICTIGRAEVGDKTMVDALVPFDDALTAAVHAGRDLPAAWSRAAEAATAAAHDTRNLLPRTGRARPHAEKSLGTPDAGAISLSLVVGAIAATLTSQKVVTP